MTIKEFANKYRVPYHVAYNASYKIKPYASMERDKDFSEKELFEETKKMLESRLKKHHKLCCQYQLAIDNLEVKYEMSEV